LTKFETFLIRKTPLGFLLRKSKGIVLPGFEGVNLYAVMQFFYKQMQTVGITERASAVAYNFIMAIPPSFLFLFTLIPQLPLVSKRDIKDQLHGLIFEIVPAKVHNANLIRFVDSFLDDAKIGLLSIGLVAALFFASNGMMGLMRSFNKNYIGFQRRTGLQERWMAIRLTVLIFSLVLGCLLLLVTQGAVLKWLGIQSAGWRTLIGYVRWIFILGLVYYSIAFIYKFAPAVQKRWQLGSPGAILATFLSVLATLGFSYFVNQFGRYNALYGSIGTIMVLMVLIYINALVLLIGFELNVSIKSLKTISAETQQP
jgi:membrane protein